MGRKGYPAEFRRRALELVAAGKTVAEVARLLEYMRAEPRVSLTVLGKDVWYQQVTLRGRVAEIADDDSLEGIDRLSIHYTGDPYARRDQQRVNAWIEVESWYAWSNGKYWDG